MSNAENKCNVVFNLQMNFMCEDQKFVISLSPNTCKITILLAISLNYVCNSPETDTTL